MYINFNFRDIEYDDNYYMGVFSAPDYNVSCEFIYDRNTEQIQIRNSNKPVEEILPLPIWWLDKKLAENGTLKKSESRT